MRTAWFIVLLALVAGGCARPRTEATEPVAAAVDPRGEVVVDGQGGGAVEWSRLVEACRGAEVVVIGENHGHAVGLTFASALWEDVLAGSVRAGLAMEFFERDEQSRVDEYLAGVVDEAAFRKRMQRTTSNYPEGHRAMVEAAKRAGRPVIAANAPRPLVRLARLEGYERLQGLTPELRRLVRVPDRMPEGRYRDDFVRLLEGGMSGEALKASGAVSAEAVERAGPMLRAQSVWDWTMAESVVRGVEAGNAPVVLVVGRFHSDFGGGLVQAIEALRAGTRVVVVSVVDADSRELREEDRGRGAFVVYVGESGS
jgi:uncharacterized iron-regulated protein